MYHHERDALIHAFLGSIFFVTVSLISLYVVRLGGLEVFKC